MLTKPYNAEIAIQASRMIFFVHAGGDRNTTRSVLTSFPGCVHPAFRFLSSNDKHRLLGWNRSHCGWFLLVTSVSQTYQQSWFAVPVLKIKTKIVLMLFIYGVRGGGGGVSHYAIAAMLADQNRSPLNTLSFFLFTSS